MVEDSSDGDSDYDTAAAETPEHTLYDRACMGMTQPLRLLYAQTLLDNGARVDEKHGAMRDTALRAATVRRDYMMMALLLRNEADPDMGTNTGCTPLHMAAWLGDLTAVRLLYDAAANVSLTTRLGYTPLDYALRAPTPAALEMVAFLVNTMGADVNARNPRTGATTLRHAVEATPNNGVSSVEVIVLLVKCGADVCAADSSGVTPLHAMCAPAKRDLLRLLLSQGEALYARDNSDNNNNTAPSQPPLLTDVLEHMKTLQRHLAFAQGRLRAQSVVSTIPLELMSGIMAHHTYPRDAHMRQVQAIATAALGWSR
jgi:ankyrin repeat protein